MTDNLQSGAAIPKRRPHQFGIYLAVTFAIAWALMIIASTIAKSFFQPLCALAMFAPMIGLLAAKGGLSTEKAGIGWKVSFKRNWRYILAAWLLPTVTTLLGAGLYFIIFRGDFDPNCGYLAAACQPYLDPDGTIQGMTMLQLTLISSVQAVIWAPLINMLLGVGEEVGWRGFLTPELEKRFGRNKALLISGVIWGIWHAPLIILAGYEYGFGYFGAPFTGVLLFCLITTALGIILSRLYEKTNCIWIPSLLHGAFNAAATLPMCFTDGTKAGYLLGPSPNGLIACIPSVMIAVTLLVKKSKSQ